MDEIAQRRRNPSGNYAEGHKRETRKSYQKYLEEISTQGPSYSMTSFGEVVYDESDNPTIPQQLRKSRRTPVPKRSFGLIDNYSDGIDPRKREIKPENEPDNVLVTPSKRQLTAFPAIDDNKQTPLFCKFLPQSSTDMHYSTPDDHGAKSVKVASDSNDESEVDMTPARRSGRTPKPKKSFALIETDFEYGGTGTPNRKVGREKTSQELETNLQIQPIAGRLEQTDLSIELKPSKEKGSKRPRKSQPTKSVTHTDLYDVAPSTTIPGFAHGLEVKQEVDPRASPEYPIQSWKGATVQSMTKNIPEIKQEQLETASLKNQNPSKWVEDREHSTEGKLHVKREGDCADCFYCKEQHVGHDHNSEICHMGHDNVPWDSADGNRSSGSRPELFVGIDHDTITLDTPRKQEKAKSKTKSDHKAKDKDNIAKLKGTQLPFKIGSPSRSKKRSEENLNDIEDSTVKKKKGDNSKSHDDKFENKKVEKLTLSLRATDGESNRPDGLSSYDAHKERKSAKKKKKHEQGESLGNLNSPDGKSDKEKTRSKGKEEYSSHSTVMERSDGHIILKLSSPGGDEGNGKEKKSTKGIESYKEEKRNNDKKRKPQKESTADNVNIDNNDHIVLKLPVPHSDKVRIKDNKKIVKRKKELDSSKEIGNDSHLKVKKKKVYKKKNGQRMLVKIVTEHVNKDGKVVKQEEQKIKKKKACSDTSSSNKFERKGKDAAEIKPSEKKVESKKTPQREKRDPGKTKSNKEKKTQTLTAYILFCRKHRPKLVAENPDMDFSQISKKMAEKWKNTPEQEKEIYKQQLQEHKAKVNAQKKTKLKYTGEKVTWEPAGKKEFPVVKYGTAYLQPVDMAAHLHLLGDALLMIATALRRQDQTTVHGALSVLLDSALCSIAPLVFLTSNVPELDVIPAETKASVLDDIAYILPGM